MAEKISLDSFLHEMITLLNKKLEAYEQNMIALREDVNRLKQSQGESRFEELNNRIRNLESLISSLRDKSQIDRSILKILESEEHGRRP